ncbi:MAG TPA: hypothetical protein ENG02_01175 [Candidatus Woesearchaeota archaeon]|nr:hypothetical protein [Candidatus Woesearchaeota archaeon]
MFVRKKKIKGKEYAYLVENKYINGRVKQKVKRYLGKVFRFDRSGDFPITTVFDKGRIDAIKDLLKKELILRGFKVRGDVLERENVVIDLKKPEVLFKGRKACIELNEGFLCGYTLRKLYRLGDGDGFAVANALLSAGIKLSKDDFVKFFERYYGGEADEHEQAD